MKNTLVDLNNHLFSQIERLGEEELTTEQLALEINRSRALAEISREIVANASLMLKAHTLATSGMHGDLPKILGA